MSNDDNVAAVRQPTAATLFEFFVRNKWATTLNGYKLCLFKSGVRPSVRPSVRSYVRRPETIPYRTLLYAVYAATVPYINLQTLFVQSRSGVRPCVRPCVRSETIPYRVNTNNTLIGRTGLDFLVFEIIQDLVRSTDIDLDFPEIS